jgi:hypothetical protein
MYLRAPGVKGLVMCGDETRREKADILIVGEI